MAALRRAFVAGLPGRVDGMRAALARGERAVVADEAHRLAGTGLSYGLPELTAWGRETESLCKRAPTAAELTRALDALATMVARLAPPKSAIG